MSGRAGAEHDECEDEQYSERDFEQEPWGKEEDSMKHDTSGFPIYCETCGEITHYKDRITTFDADYCNTRCYSKAIARAEGSK